MKNVVWDALLGQLELWLVAQDFAGWRKYLYR